VRQNKRWGENEGWVRKGARERESERHTALASARETGGTGWRKRRKKGKIFCVCEKECM